MENCLLAFSHKDTDLRPLLVSTATRMWCELHPKDTCTYRRQETEETPDERHPKRSSIEDGEETTEGAGCVSSSSYPGVQVTIAGKNPSYPNELAGFIRDKEYLERLLELVGGCPRLPEAGALTADQIYAQVGNATKGLLCLSFLCFSFTCLSVPLSLRLWLSVPLSLRLCLSVSLSLLPLFSYVSIWG